MKRISLTALMLVLVVTLMACGTDPGAILCVEDMTADVNCLGTIDSLDGSRTLTASSDQLGTGMWEAQVSLSVESGSVLVSFADADGNIVSQEISQGGVAEGSAGIVDGTFDVTLETAGGSASGISYTISLNEVEN